MPTRKSWIIAASVIAVLIAIVLLAAAFDAVQLRRLQQAARSIKIGDESSRVVTLLGNPHATYPSSVQQGGRPATVWVCYGGLLARSRFDFDCRMNATFGSRWSQDRLPRRLREWAVRVEIDPNGRVVSIYR